MTYWPNDPLSYWSVGRWVKFIKHRTTSHLTFDIKDALFSMSLDTLAP